MKTVSGPISLYLQVTPGMTIIAKLWLVWIQCYSRPHPRSAPSRHCVRDEVVSTPEEKTSEADDELITCWREIEREKTNELEGETVRGKNCSSHAILFCSRKLKGLGV